MKVQCFKNFGLTKESLASADALRHYLQQQVDAGTLLCRSIDVVDLDVWRRKAHESYHAKPIEAQYVGYIRYKLGRLATIIADRKLHKENRARRKVARSPKFDFRH